MPPEGGHEPMETQVLCRLRNLRLCRCRSQLMGGLPAVPFHVHRHGSRAKFRSYSRDFRS
jgi:hypothetical protein